MQNISEIRQHINAVTETRKITGAMQMVASSRMKKTMSHMEYNDLYSQRLLGAMKEILQSSQDVSHPYLQKPRGSRRTYIVVAGDKGMAGSYNSNVLQTAYREIQKQPNLSHLITLGIKTSMFFRQKGLEPFIEISDSSEYPSLINARRLIFSITDLYDQNLTDEVYMVYTRFSGPDKHQAVSRRLLPLLLTDFDRFQAKVPPEQDIIYLPSDQEAFDLLIPQFLTSRMFAALVQAYASEHLARMTAMQSATRNADEILKKLKLEYNMARQAAITREITEITGAAEALRNGDAAYAAE